MSKNKDKQKVYKGFYSDKYVYILGAAPAYIPKINNIYYYQITLKYKNTKDIIKEMHYLNKIYSNNKLVKIEIDFNPIKI